MQLIGLSNCEFILFDLAFTMLIQKGKYKCKLHLFFFPTLMSKPQIEIDHL